MAHLAISDMKENERLLWDRVDELWKCSVNQDFTTIEEAIHPKYIGWDNNSLLPHDRNYAIRSVVDKSVRLLEYQLQPLKISLYDDRVGIANYRYNASLEDIQKNVRGIKGRWTEIFIKEAESWILIGVHGGPEPVKVLSSANIY